MKSDTQLIFELKGHIQEVLTFLQKREKVIGIKDFSVSVDYPLNPNKGYNVRINCYLMDKEMFKTSFENKTLKEALQDAINEVFCWYEFEKNASSMSSLRRTFIEELM